MKVSDLIAALSHYDSNLYVVNKDWEPYETNNLSHVGNCVVLDHRERGYVAGSASLGVMTEDGDKPSPPLKLGMTNLIPQQRGPFDEGTLVCLKTGGPLMTVEDVRSDGCVGTVWFSDGEVHRDGFHPSHLNVLMLA